MKPTPENPFLFVVDGVIPALKNSHNADFTTPKEIANWYKDQKPKLLKQREAQKDLESLEKDDFAYCVFEYFYPNRLPKGDLDNCYTTVQEFLQRPSADHVKRKHKGILGVFPNDKQVAASHQVCHPLGEKTVIGAFLWVWCDDPQLGHVKQLVLWDTYRRSNLIKRLNLQTNPARLG